MSYRLKIPLREKQLYWYPNVNLFTFNDEMLNIDPEFENTIYDYFLGIRKLVAIKQCSLPPRTIVVDPWRTCNLVCKYCYAGAGPIYTKKADKNIIKKIVQNYGIKEIMIFGGEPLIDKFYIENITENNTFNDIFISTNGILLDDNFVINYLNKNDINIQVSLEPYEWGQRVNLIGDKQLNLLNDRFYIINKIRSVHFRVTIPPTVKYVPLRHFLDNIISSMGHSKFSIDFWPMSGIELPEWLYKWISESEELLNVDPLRYGDKVLSTEIFQVFFRESLHTGFRYYNCTAGYASAAVGPDSRIHACHELGVVESSEDVISKDDDPSQIDEDKKIKWTYRESNNMSNAECRKCPAKFMCGGICFLEKAKPQATCNFIIKTIPLAIKQYIAVKPDEFAKFVELSEKRFYKMYSIKDVLKEEVKREEWKELVSGVLPLERAQELAKNL